MPDSTAQTARWDDRKFHFDPNKPRWVQIVWLVVQIFGLFGGLVLALISMFAYPMLLTGTGYAVVYLGPIVACFVISFLIIPHTWFPADMPVSARFQMRFGVGLFAAAWFVGLFGITNGYATPVVVRDAPMVYRRTSTPSDPHQMSYYVGTRVWPSSSDVYEITVQRAFYESLAVPVTTQWYISRRQLDAMPNDGLLHLRIGRGRLGINWLEGVDDAVSSPGQH